MAQQPLELILLRQWASHITLAVFLVDAQGQLLYYNDAAARLLGRPYDEAGDLSVANIGERFAIADRSGQPLAESQEPLRAALAERRPSMARLRFQGLDGRWRDVTVVGLPLISVDRRLLGAAAVLWEAED